MKPIKQFIKKLLKYFNYDIIRFNKHTKRSEVVIKIPFLSPTILKAIKVNYGCGQKLMKNWLNVDINIEHKTEYMTVNVDLRGKHPFLNNQFKYGYAEDFLEHLSQSDQIVFFQEVYRTFKKNGVLRLSFPGFEGILNEHYEPGYYNDPLIAKQNAYTQWEHVHYPCKNELLMICKKIGFRKVTFVKYGKSNFKELRGLDTRYLQKSINIYVEIVK
jgi:predicted SAM-dependent methyltransferase